MNKLAFSIPGFLLALNGCESGDSITTISFDVGTSEGRVALAVGNVKFVFTEIPYEGKLESSGELVVPKAGDSGSQRTWFFGEKAGGAGKPEKAVEGELVYSHDNGKGDLAIRFMKPVERSYSFIVQPDETVTFSGESYATDSDLREISVPGDSP